jgi:hypothetical protein
MNIRPPHVNPDRESWREQVRQLPGVVVHRPQPPVPYVPDLRVTNVRDLHDLTGESATETEEVDSVE